MTNSKTLMTLAISVIGSGVLAQEFPASLTTMFRVTGECEMFIFADEQLPCRHIMINTEYDSGRVGFYFLYEVEGGGIISFSGIGQEQLSPTESIRLQPLDALIIEGERENAVGFCTFENPFVGQARVGCAAYLESGELFAGFFLSDGSQPEMLIPAESGG
jgi:hypothetical protein